uniref:Uncharacterized protein n=1 Tax=Curvibacter symbiont subsp. Hydra magnipapillata TaxID=667019 RepID=C9Y986_CURXX|nr:hypothetical protein Csp_A06870 [Curvibacter putative symbiont of Hydra magnipapillata]
MSNRHFEELAEAVEQHAFKRLEDRWSELMQASNKGPLIRALQVKEIGLRAFSLDQIIQLSGETQLGSDCEKV